jgi:hypothetical protein
MDAEKLVSWESDRFNALRRDCRLESRIATCSSTGTRILTCDEIEGSCIAVSQGNGVLSFRERLRVRSALCLDGELHVAIGRSDAPSGEKERGSKRGKRKNGQHDSGLKERSRTVQIQITRKKERGKKQKRVDQKSPPGVTLWSKVQLKRE